jgi:hypothetical protein
MTKSVIRSIIFVSFFTRSFADMSRGLSRDVEYYFPGDVSYNVYGHRTLPMLLHDVCNGVLALDQVCTPSILVTVAYILLIVAYILVTVAWMLFGILILKLILCKPTERPFYCCNSCITINLSIFST